jgi:hypothetical protein
MAFIEKLNAVVADLKSNSEIFVAHYQVLPADLGAIDRVEAALGYKLDASITNFYKECGGVQLLWLHESNDSFDNIKENFVSTAPLDDWYIKGEHINFFPEGCIWIPSIEAVFLTNWEDNGMDFDIDDFDAAITNDFEDFKIQVLDWFSAFNDVAFLINGSANPPLVLGDDNQATYSESHYISFDLYLDLLLKSKGEKEARVDFLNKNSNDAIDSWVTAEDIEAIEA